MEKRNWIMTKVAFVFLTIIYSFSISASETKIGSQTSAKTLKCVGKSTSYDVPLANKLAEIDLKSSTLNPSIVSKLKSRAQLEIAKMFLYRFLFDRKFKEGLECMLSGEFITVIGSDLHSYLLSKFDISLLKQKRSKNLRTVDDKINLLQIENIDLNNELNFLRDEINSIKKKLDTEED